MAKKRERTGVVVVFVTCPAGMAARRLAEGLVRRRVAACVNVVPSVSSVFWWKGKIDRAQEALLVIKTDAGRLRPLQAAILSLHPYEVPEMIALPVQSGYHPYLQWVIESVRPGLLGGEIEQRA